MSAEGDTAVKKVSVEAVKALREKTGAPIGDCRSALEKAGGDEGKAAELLKQRGFEQAQKRAGRATAAGRVESYIHHDGRVGVLIEVNCETDFVGRTDEFQAFCRDIAMQVASLSPDTVEALLEQPFVKDPKQTIQQLLTALIAKTGENVVIRRFKRFGLGEEQS